MPDLCDARVLFFVDPIEASSYPVTETGYALLYRMWGRLSEGSGQGFVALPEPQLVGASVLAQRVTAFRASPYDHYRSQRDHYDPRRDQGAEPCHEVDAPERVHLGDFDVVMWRRETGPQRALLEALAEVEEKALVYLSPRLALDPNLGSKVLPERLAPDALPISFDTASVPGRARDKVEAASTFLRDTLDGSGIAKPRDGDNGVGITILGVDPRDPNRAPPPARAVIEGLIERFTDVVVQEYLASVRRPADLSQDRLSDVPLDRRDFGEVRFLIVDGDVPRNAEGQPFVMARRVPTSSSLVADSGISYATTLSDRELAFVRRIGAAYEALGIHFGGGDLIRTPDPDRPFCFTDAAQSVCGHAVVTGALNGEPYGVVDRVIDSVAHQLTLRAEVPA